MCPQTLRANGKSQLTTFVLVFFPGTFLLVSLIVSKFVVATGERLETRLAQAGQKHKEFGQIVEVLKSRGPEGKVRLSSDFYAHPSYVCPQPVIETSPPLTTAACASYTDASSIL